MSRHSQRNSEVLLETVRKHFREAISQEKSRLATFDFHIARRASEQLVPSAAEAEECIAAADVIDLATLKRYRRQHKDLPSEVREAILCLGGGVVLNRQRLQAIAKQCGHLDVEELLAKKRRLEQLDGETEQLECSEEQTIQCDSFPLAQELEKILDSSSDEDVAVPPPSAPPPPKRPRTMWDQLDPEAAVLLDGCSYVGASLPPMGLTT